MGGGDVCEFAVDVEPDSNSKEVEGAANAVSSVKGGRGGGVMKFECRTDALKDERFSFGRFELVDARRDGLAEFFFFRGIRWEFSPLDNMIYERGRY